MSGGKGAGEYLGMAEIGGTDELQRVAKNKQNQTY